MTPEPIDWDELPGLDGQHYDTEDNPTLVSLVDHWRNLAHHLREENEKLKAKLALWEPLIEERDSLADRLSEWAMAADRHGVPDELENLPEAAFDYVCAKDGGLKWPFR